MNITTRHLTRLLAAVCFIVPLSGSVIHSGEPWALLLPEAKTQSLMSTTVVASSGFDNQPMPGMPSDMTASTQTSAPQIAMLDASAVDATVTGSIKPYAPLLATARKTDRQGRPIEVASAGDPVVAVTEPARTGPDEVDLAALYYYAEQKQTDRVEAEAARLRVKYPDFQLPNDLYVPLAQRSVNEQSLWALYDKNDFPGIETEVQRLTLANPGWVPSQDFTDKLTRRRERAIMTEAYAAKDWTGVISAASGIDPATETEADLLWMLIDSYRETDMKDDLLGVYRGILFRDAGKRLPDDLLVTTMQKATRDFSADEVRTAMQTLWPTPGAVAALAPINNDLLRRDVAEFNADDARKEPLADKDIKRLKDLAATGETLADDSLLGWYYLKLKQPKDAEPFFTAAVAKEPTPEFAKGLYLSLAQQGRDQEAFNAAASHLKALTEDPEFLMNALSVRFSKPELGAVDADSVEAYSTTILETLSADHAEILAWYAYNSQQFEASEAWFSKSWDWEAAPARLKGLALSYMRENKKKELATLRTQYEAKYPDIFKEIVVADPPRGAKGSDVAKPRNNVQAAYLIALKSKRYGDCISELQAQEANHPLPRDVQLIKGWCQMGLNRLTEAKDAFNAALPGGGQIQQDAAYGIALAALRGKLTDDAESIVAAYPLTAARNQEIWVEIYWQRARSAFDHKQYQQALDALNARLKLTPEASDLSTLRAWAHFKLGHRAEAQAIFERLNMRFSEAGLRSGLATVKGQN